MMLRRLLTSVYLLIVPSTTFAIVYLEPPCDFNPKVEVVGCFMEYEGKILLLHRQDHKEHGNCWAVPGGKIDKGETPTSGIAREVFEETGFDISQQPITYLTKVYIQGHAVDHIYHMVKCKLEEPPGSVKITFEEHKGFTWVTPQDALNMKLMLDEDTCIKLIYE